MGETQVGVQARLMSHALRKLAGVVSKSKTSVIFINQIRQKIGVMYGSNETTPGGNALKFYSSVRLDIRRITSLKDGEDVIGNRTRVKVVKNKVAPPFKKVEFDLMYGTGISSTGEILDYGVNFDIVDKSGSWFSYGKTRLGQGRENVKQFLVENEDLRKDIEGKMALYPGLTKIKGISWTLSNAICQVLNLDQKMKIGYLIDVEIEKIINFFKNL